MRHVAVPQLALGAFMAAQAVASRIRVLAGQAGLKEHGAILPRPIQAPGASPGTATIRLRGRYSRRLRPRVEVEDLLPGLGGRFGIGEQVKVMVGDHARVG
jgi:hypothetical protein